jgi:hypothetical protein
MRIQLRRFRHFWQDQRQIDSTLQIATHSPHKAFDDSKRGSVQYSIHNDHDVRV